MQSRGVAPSNNVFLDTIYWLIGGVSLDFFYVTLSSPAHFLHVSLFSLLHWHHRSHPFPLAFWYCLLQSHSISMLSFLKPFHLAWCWSLISIRSERQSGGWSRITKSGQTHQQWWRSWRIRDSSNQLQGNERVFRIYLGLYYSCMTSLMTYVGLCLILVGLWFVSICGMKIGSNSIRLELIGVQGQGS